MPKRFQIGLRWGLAGALSSAFAGSAGCVSSGSMPETVSPSRIGHVEFIGPRCPEVRSCLVGQVVAAETATPLPRAAVFLERETDASAATPVRILTLTDDQGVFTVADAPLGTYRLAIYKDARRIERHGLKLGAPGTTLVPVRLSPS
jgi:hypothetical protein